MNIKLLPLAMRAGLAGQAGLSPDTEYLEGLYSQNVHYARKSRLTLAIRDAQEFEHYAELEREYLGDPELGTGIYDYQLIYPMGRVPTRFLDAMESTEVIDFNLYLSPQEAI